MIDVLTFSAPFGIFGRPVEKLVLRRYLERLLRMRAETIKESAQTPGE